MERRKDDRYNEKWRVAEKFDTLPEVMKDSTIVNAHAQMKSEVVDFPSSFFLATRRYSRGHVKTLLPKPGT